MMSLWLHTSLDPDGADSYGALNLYSDSIDPFGPNEYAMAQALAAQISVALAAHREIRGRGVAMTSRTIIGHRGNLDAEARHRRRSSFRVPATGLSEQESQVDHHLQRDRQYPTASPVIT